MESRENPKYMINAYRVLLTRARQRIAICVVRVFERSGVGGAVQRIAIVFFIFLLCPIQTFCIFAEVLLKLFEDTI